MISKNKVSYADGQCEFCPHQGMNSIALTFAKANKQIIVCANCAAAKIYSKFTFQDYTIFAVVALFTAIITATITANIVVAIKW